ncbi:MAG TPA: ROK family protein [Terracidiphilus sp.]
MRSFSIGVDLGGTNLRAATYDPATGLSNRRVVPTRIEDGPIAVAEDICRLILDAQASQDSSASCVGVCVGAPGPLELPSGRFHQPPNLTGWDGFDLREVLEKHLDIPVYLENDANAAALAEYYLGSGKQLGVDSLSMLSLGTGVGHGIIYEGRIFHGANGLAGEAGHVTVEPEGELCNCGNHGCLEMYATSKAIRRAAVRLAANGAQGLAQLLAERKDASAGDIYSLAMTGDADALSIFDRAGRALGICVAALVNTLNPQLIVIAGGISDAWPLLSRKMFEELELRSYIYRLTKPGSRFERHTIVQKAVLGPDAGLTGAALYPFIYGQG